MNKSNEMTLNLEKIPRQLVEDAKAKCKQQEPPRPLRWQIIELLKQWTYHA